MTSLRDHIRSILDSTDLTDPHDVAAAVASDANAQMRKEWMDEVLPGYVASVMRDSRNKALNGAASGRRTPSKSAKVSGIRDWWSQLMDSRIAVGDAWKPVGDCTSNDLAVIIEVRRDAARAINAQADKYEMLLALLGEHGVSTIRELPADSAIAATVQELAA